MSGGYWVSSASVVHRADGPCRGRRCTWTPERAFDFDRACLNCRYVLPGAEQ